MRNSEEGEKPVILTHTAQRETRLLSILRRELGMSSGLASRLKFGHSYTVNGQPVFTNFIVHPGDEICVRLDEPEPDYPAEDGPLTILYEDEALIALEKPPGLLMHPSFSRNEGTLANYLAGYYKRTGQRCAVHPVSRLDRDTFGVVLLAKNAYVHELMRRQHAGGGMEKTYHALTCDIPDPPEGEIDAPIARVPGDSLLREIRQDGKPASSRYRVLEARAGCAKLELSPLTGRTHQLRLHCAYLGCPILGDPQYGTPGSLTLSARYGIAGQQLCAVRLRFLHPMTKKTVEIRATGDVSLDFLERTVV